MFDTVPRSLEFRGTFFVLFKQSTFTKVYIFFKIYKRKHKPMKTCIKCKEQKEESLFRQDGGKDNKEITNICRVCSNLRNKTYYYKSTKSLLKRPFRNCVVNAENGVKYYTLDLKSEDIIILKQLGYGFIFKSM